MSAALHKGESGMKRFIRAVCLVTALFALTVSGMTAQTTSDGLRYERNHEGGVTITKYTGNAATLTIPAALDGIPVTTIEFAAFSGCAGLTGVTIPN